MTDPDVRWLQRLGNYGRALAALERALTSAGSRELSELEQLGLVKAFEYTHELAWNTLRDLTSHVYNRSTAEIISSNIANRYLASFQSLRSKLETLAHDAEP